MRVGAVFCSIVRKAERNVEWGFSRSSVLAKKGVSALSMPQTKNLWREVVKGLHVARVLVVIVSMILGVLILPRTPYVSAAAENRQYSVSVSPDLVDYSGSDTTFTTTVRNESQSGNVKYISVQITVPSGFTLPSTVPPVTIDANTRWVGTVSGNVVTYTVTVDKGSTVQAGIGPGSAQDFPVPASFDHTGSTCGTGYWTTLVKDNGEAVGDPYTDVGLIGGQPTITINCPPVAVNDSYSVYEGNSLTVDAPGVLTNDSDPNAGDVLTALLDSTVPAGSGTLNLSSDGSFTFTPAAGFMGTVTFTYKAYDGRLESGVATVTITVMEIDDPPSATSDTYSTDEDVALVVPAPGVLANDTDPEGQTLTAEMASAPTNGTVVLNADGSFTYTPNANFSGLDSFTYKAKDGTQYSDPATVSITVNPINDRPTAVNDAYTATEDTTLTVDAPGVLANDTDVDSPSLTAVLVSTTSNGTLNLNSNGSFTYTPNSDFAGTDTFSYMANDGTADSNVATVTITVSPVNDGPTARENAYETDEDQPLNAAAPGVLGNDTDPDGDTLEAVLVTDVTHGTLTLNADGSFTYTPDARYSGSDSFTYKANDGTSDSNTVTVALTINPVNDAPVAVDDTMTTDEDQAKQFTWQNLLGNDSDEEGSPLTGTILTQPGHGTLAWDPETETFTYTPEANFDQQDCFTYKVNDGELDSRPANVCINITPINDPPVAVNDSFTINEDETLNVTPNQSVLVNDSDPDTGNTLTAIRLSTTEFGTLTFGSDGTFTYVPLANWSGTDSFTYQASDGNGGLAEATVDIVVNPVADAPVAQDDGYTVAEDGSLTVLVEDGVLDNDSDGDGDELSAVLVTDVQNGTLELQADGSFTYTPNANFFGQDTFTYKANDGTLDSNIATVTITVTAVDDLPDAADDAYSTDEDTELQIAAPGVLGNDVDADGEALTAVLLNGPTHGTLTLNPDGSFTYMPNADFSGSDSFSYKATTGLQQDIATVTITVNPVNDGPNAVDDQYSTAEDVALVVPAPGVLVNDTDTEGDSLTLAVTDLPDNGTLTLEADGSFTYTPAANFNGTDTFVYQISDGTLTDEATVTITVNAVNDAPVAANDSYSVPQDGTLTRTAATGVRLNDTDVDTPVASLLISLVSDVSNGSLTLNADGSFTYTPTAFFNGTDTFTYKANDGALDSNVATVTITVEPGNTRPVAVADTYPVVMNQKLTVAATGVLGNDTDADGNDLEVVVSSVTGPSHGTLTILADGSFEYTPETNYVGTDTFTYTVTDSAAESLPATVTLTVANRTPIALDDSFSTLVETELTGTVLANDSDPDGHPVTVSLGIGPDHGSLTLNGDGTFTYTPDNGFIGWDGFTYVVSDGVATSAAATVEIEVYNDLPEATDDTYSTEYQTALTVQAPGVLSNDSDPNGHALTAVLLNGPADGSLTLNPDGSFTYTPNDGFEGTDSFTYLADDGFRLPVVPTVAAMVEGGSPVATVTITVGEAPTPLPTAVPDVYSIPAGQTLVRTAANGVLANDVDPLGVGLFAIEMGDGEEWTLNLHDDGSFTFSKPTAGTYVYQYRVCDNYERCGNTTTITIRVTPPFDPGTTDFQVQRLVSTTNDAATGSASITVDSGTTVYHFLRITATGTNPVAISQANDSVLGAVIFPSTVVSPGLPGVVTIPREVSTTETGTLTVVGSGLTRTATSTVTVNKVDETGSITVIVTTPAGDPIPGATVNLGGQTGTTEADGMFTFENLPLGEYTVSVTASNPANPGDASKSGTQSATLSTAQPDQTVAFQFAWEALNLGITVNVLDVTIPAAERAIEGALVTLGTLKGYTNVDGQIFFDNLPAGDYEVTASAHNPRLAVPAQLKTAKTTLTLSDSPQTITLRLSWLPEPANIGSLTVEVVDKATGKHVPNAKISLTNGKTTTNATVDADGFHTFGQIDAGTYTVNAQSPDGVKAGSKDVSVIAQASNRVVVEIDGATAVLATGTGDLSGRICRPRAPGVTLIAKGPGGEEQSVTIPSTGVLGQWVPYSFKALTTGLWKILFTVGGEVKAEQTVQVLANGTATIADFELACTGGEGPTQSPLAWILYLAGGALLLTGLILRSRKRHA